MIVSGFGSDMGILATVIPSPPLPALHPLGLQGQACRVGLELRAFDRHHVLAAASRAAKEAHDLD